MQVFKHFAAGLSVVFLSACGGSSGGSSATEAYGYVFGTNSSVAALSSRNQNGQVVITNSPVVSSALKRSSNGETELAALFAVDAGRLVVVTQEDSSPKTVSSLTSIDGNFFCDTRVQENGSAPRFFFSRPGNDQNCATKQDNTVFYVDASMGEDDAPIQLSTGSLFSALRVEEIYSTAHEVAGYLVREQAGDGVALRYYDRSFSTNRTIDAGPNYDPTSETFSVWPFSGTSRSIIRLGNEYYDVSAGDLEAGRVGARFLAADGQPDVALTPNTAYLAIGSQLYRHNIGAATAPAFSTLNLASGVDIAILENGTIVSSDDNLNANRRRFLRVDESGESVAFRPLTQADYDRTGTTSSSLRVSSTGNAALVNISLRYQATDDLEYALYIASDDTVTRFDDAQWVDTAASTAPHFDRALFAQEQGGQLRVAEINPDNVSAPLIYGDLPPGVQSVRAESFSVRGKLVLTTRSSQSDLNGQVYLVTLGEAGSLQRVGDLTGFTVFNI